jgi:hypothetical protein
MYLFNSTEWCYIKRTTDNVLQILLQVSRWRVKTANTILQQNAQLITFYKFCYNRLGKGYLLGKYPGNGRKAEKLRIGKQIPLPSTNQKTAFWYKV